MRTATTTISRGNIAIYSFLWEYRYHRNVKMNIQAGSNLRDRLIPLELSNIKYVPMIPQRNKIVNGMAESNMYIFFRCSLPIKILINKKTHTKPTRNKIAPIESWEYNL